ncbi:MAG TPA: tRNA uridine-5-carboxymethylaminomethyl(34) synthesis GTPase MnmE [Ruminococcaceae bacterium]|nr:tRNA uridine-5-carboxymethylaminomethyl(34) synthesis GTPase MnmE [Oscillospiraceae bacterium]
MSTIAAISTGLAAGGIGIVRISGENALNVADSIFKTVQGIELKKLSGYRAAFGKVFSDGKPIDEAVALVFRAPKSYTGEDVVEISCHGGLYITKQVLRAALKNGAVPAEPGEFTKRAFLNGKTDLARAESIMGLISAKNESQLRLSRAAHLGKISEKIDGIISRLTTADAAIAVYSDYPDEEIEGLDRESFLSSLKACAHETEQMLSTYNAGRVLREGIETVIVGKPNVGKSTLMNMLSGAERSIVTEVAGTTRDVIEDTVNVGDIMLRLADTAGIRDTDDRVESIGVELAKKRIELADLVLAVFDITKPLDNDDKKLLELVKHKNTVVILNKSDMGNSADMSAFADFRTVVTSAVNGGGYDALCREIADIVGTAGLDPESAVLINERQRACAERALDGINEAITALNDGNTVDAVGVCVDDALAALLELTGRRVTNEVSDEIFRKFCVGK